MFEPYACARTRLPFRVIARAAPGTWYLDIIAVMAMSKASSPADGGPRTGMVWERQISKVSRQRIGIRMIRLLNRSVSIFRGYISRCAETTATYLRSKLRVPALALPSRTDSTIGPVFRPHGRPTVSGREGRRLLESKDE